MLQPSQSQLTFSQPPTKVTNHLSTDEDHPTIAELAVGWLGVFSLRRNSSETCEKGVER